jgi:hypothetical protein
MRKVVRVIAKTAIVDKEIQMNRSEKLVHATDRVEHNFRSLIEHMIHVKKTERMKELMSNITIDIEEIRNIAVESYKFFLENV